MRFATAACNFCASELQKVLRSWRVLYVLTSKCASRHSGVQFFDIRTSISAPSMGCFVHFHFKMRFSPQRSAIFQHQNFKKCSRTLVFLCIFIHFDFKMCFSPQRRGIIDFSAEHLYLRTRRFNRPTFRLTRHTNHWKNAAFRDFSNIWRGCISSLLQTYRASASSFCWLDYSTLLFNCPYCRKLDF